MNKSLRARILNKLAQTTTPATEEVIDKALPAPPAVPGDVFSHLNEGYNGGTVKTLTDLLKILNTSLHYVSNGKDNVQKISTNNSDLSGAVFHHKNIGAVTKKIYDTFFARKNPFPKKLEGQQITDWANGILNMSEFNNLAQISPSGPLAQKIGRNLKSIILDSMNSIKAQNPNIT